MSNELECGSRLGEWELTERIGEGGGGHVWRARGAEGAVALKVISPELVEKEEVRGRFIREVKAIRRVVHPNVVRYLDAGDIDGQLFLVMELLDGESLETRLATVGRLPAEDVIRMGCEIAGGLGAVHAAGIVHRDMKPTNIQLCSDGVAKLIDFGIAKWTDTHMDLTQMTRTGHIMGTPNYMAPEQASALRDESERTDVWGLGATLYDATVGHPPFGSDDPPLMAMLGRILTMDPVEMPDDVPPELRSALLQALQKDPDKRFQTMAAFARALSPSMPAPEEATETRYMSVMLSRSASEHDAGRVMHQVQHEGGDGYALPQNLVLGVFGGKEWIGDEPERAARAAYASRGFVIGGGVASGRGSWPPVGGRVSGEVAEAAEAALAAAVGDGGFIVDTQMRQQVSGLFDVDGTGRLARRRGVSLSLRTRGARGKTLPFLARKQEMMMLGGALMAAAAAEESTALVIEAEPGMGKSRMLVELRAWAAQRLDAPRFLEARADSARRLSTLSLMRSLLETADFDLTGCGDATRIFLGELLGAPTDDVRIEAVRRERQALHEGIHAAVRELLGTWCAKGPVVVLVDDLHLVDDASLSMLDRLLAELPLALVGTSRLGDDQWAKRRPHLAAATRVMLNALDEPAVRKLVKAVVDGIPDDVAGDIAERAAGNPYFASELAAAGGRGETLPLSIEASMQSRLAALPGAEREVLLRASVLGRTFSVSALDALGVSDPLPRLQELARRGLVRSRGARWSFCHELLIGIAEGMLTQQQRIELHGAAARWLGDAGPPELVAKHLEIADETEAAARAWLRVAQRSDARTVVEATTRALRLHMQPTLEAELRFARAQAFQISGKPEALEEELDALEALEPSLPREAKVRSLMRTLRAQQLAAHDTDAAVAKHSEAIAAADATGDLALRIDARCVFVSFLSRVDAERASVIAASALDLARQGVDRVTLARVHGACAFVANYRGDRVRAFRAWQSQVAELEQAGVLDRSLFGAKINLGYALRGLGAHQQAVGVLEEARSGADRFGAHQLRAWAEHNLGLAVAHHGDPATGLRWELSAERFAMDNGAANLAIAARLYAGAIANLMHNPDLAIEKVDMALAEARALGRATVQASCHIQRAIAFNQRHAHAQALAETDIALSIREAEGGIPEFEHELWLARAEALAALEQNDAAHQAREQALRIAQDMRAAHIEALTGS